MRFSLSTAVAALPALASAQDFQQYQAQFQDLLGQISSYVPNPGKYDHASAQEAKNGPLKLHTFTLENWNDTLYGPVAPTATVPEEWWVLVTGRNKTCFGMLPTRCARRARNALLMAMLTDDQATATSSRLLSTSLPDNWLLSLMRLT
jgi:hypothetical protein